MQIELNCETLAIIDCGHHVLQGKCFEVRALITSTAYEAECPWQMHIADSPPAATGGQLLRIAPPAALKKRTRARSNSSAPKLSRHPRLSTSASARLSPAKLGHFDHVFLIDATKGRA